MTTYKLREGCGRHTTEDGDLIKAGETFETKSNLKESFPDKFDVVTAATKKKKVSEDDNGEDVTEAFAEHIHEIDAKIFKNGRRYRIVMDETVVNTTPSRLTNGEKVIEALAALQLAPDDEAEVDEE